MISPQTFAKLGHDYQYLINRLPVSFAIKMHSWGRIKFMQMLAKHCIETKFIPPNNSSKTLWGIKFASSIFNSAGVFKSGECYDLVARQGAGAYLGGTSTHNMRVGNMRNGIKQPFISLPDAKLAVNFLGLPNKGDRVLVDKKITANKIDGCPIGWSLMRSPDFENSVALNKLIESLQWYQAKPEIDFIEINESCPNVANNTDNVYERLEIIAQKFLRQRTRNLPVIVKFSNDILPEQLLSIIEHLIKLRFDGITLGNTSVNYAQYANLPRGNAKKLYDYFTQEFGGGLSGNILKRNSLQLCETAIRYVKSLDPNHEFHIIRSGGIDCAEDLFQSEQIGVSLNQWYTGYFSNYIQYGDDVYKNLLERV